MQPLADIQNNFIDTINNGPDRLAPYLFAGPPERIWLGLKAHANTINHARIVALEETFPLTRAHMGDAPFNALARAFVETHVARSSDTNHIGSAFPDYLREPATRELAQIEWAWLESYNAAEAQPMMLTDLNAMSETALLALKVAPHPSVRRVPIFTTIAATLEEMAGQKPAAIFCVRPDAEVRLFAIDVIQNAVLAASERQFASLGNLLAVAIEYADEQAPLEPVLNLISAGALVMPMMDDI